jgi:hypothetical protein
MAASDWEFTRKIYEGNPSEGTRYPRAQQDMLNLLTMIEQHDDLLEMQPRTLPNLQLYMLIPGTQKQIHVARPNLNLFWVVAGEEPEDVADTVLKHLNVINSTEDISEFLLDSIKLQQWIRRGSQYLLGWESVTAFIKRSVSQPSHFHSPEKLVEILSSIHSSVDLPNLEIWASTSPGAVYFELPAAKRVVSLGKYFWKGFSVSQEMAVRSKNIVPVLRYAIASLK